jgi:hypothetical protein
MKDIEFINMLKTIKQKGDILSDIPVMLKIDGFGFRIGKELSGKLYVKTSNSGEIYRGQEFIDYIELKGITDPLQIKRAEMYRDLADSYLNGFLCIPCDTEVCMEVLMYKNGLTPMRMNTIKFVHIAYPCPLLGQVATLFPHTVLDSVYNEEHPESKQIIDGLLMESNNNYKFINPFISFKNVNILKELEWVFKVLDIPNVEQILTSRKKIDKVQKESIKHVLQERKDLFSEYILSQVVGTNLMGEMFEGIMFKINDTWYKVTTLEFKELMKQ